MPTNEAIGLTDLFAQAEDVIENDFVEYPGVRFELNEPFFFDGWFVVRHRTHSLGEVFFSERENREFELVERIPENVFGHLNTYGINWLHEDENEYPDEDYDMTYEFSIEREETDTRNDIIPVLTTNIDRDVPLISFEQEFSGNGNIVVRALTDIGLALSRYVEGYHSSDGRYNRTADGENGICYVETDSSCGYELIFDRLDLKDRTIAEKVSRAQKIMRELKENDVIRLAANCGFHVHVDVKNWGMKEIVSAYHLWNYMEDTIFRFASAFWSSHRDEEVGGGYSVPVPKGARGRRDIGNILTERRDSLNFSHILRAKSQCRCGAAHYEDWENCVCNLSQPTLEFRVFNATLNQRKIRAYLAFCVAFVNMAKKIEHDPEKFPVMRWRGTSYKENDAGETWEERSAKRMNYILKEFPLTNTERRDIEYCFRNCSLEPVLDFTIERSDALFVE